MRMRHRWWRPAAIGLLALLALSACGGGGERLTDMARVDIALEPGGDAEVDVRVGGGRVSSVDDLRALGLRLARAVFPGAKDVEVTARDEPGAPMARARVLGAYRPGRRVSLRLDTAGIWRETAARGVPRTVVRLWLPHVPATVRGEPRPERSYDGTWTVGRSSAGRDSHVDVVMRPQPLRWYAVMALLPVAVVGLSGALASRRTVTVLPAAALAVVAAAGTIAVSGAGQGDNLGVAGVSGVTGRLEGMSLAVASGAPLVTVLCGLLGTVVLAVRTVRALRRPVPRPAARTHSHRPR